MAPKKEAVEISCSECDTDFRLWIPADSLPEWEKGSRISCIRCGAQYLVKKDKKGFSVTIIKKTAAGQRPPATAAPAAPPPTPPAAQAPAYKPKEAPQPKEAAEPKETVLLVDDDRLAREMAENSLKDAGVRLVTVKNAVEALSVLKREKISLVVTDLYLKNPDDPQALIDGEDLLRKISDLGQNIPAIITTGKDIIDDMVLDPKWFDLHVKGFIQKGNPFWVEDLKMKIKEVLYKD